MLVLPWRFLSRATPRQRQSMTLHMRKFAPLTCSLERLAFRKRSNPARLLRRSTIASAHGFIWSDFLRMPTVFGTLAPAGDGVPEPQAQADQGGDSQNIPGLPPFPIHTLRSTSALFRSRRWIAENAIRSFLWSSSHSETVCNASEAEPAK